MPHKEGNFDSRADANAKVRSLKGQGYAARIVVTKYGPHTPPLYTVFRADEKGQAYPPIKRSR